jgi:hypothetical protein
MPIMARFVLQIENLSDYKVHFAKWNGGHQPVDVFTRDRREWQGWEEYRPERDDSRPIVRRFRLKVVRAIAFYIAFSIVFGCIHFFTLPPQSYVYQVKGGLGPEFRRGEISIEALLEKDLTETRRPVEGELFS